MLFCNRCILGQRIAKVHDFIPIMDSHEMSVGDSGLCLHPKSQSTFTSLVVMLMVLGLHWRNWVISDSMDHCTSTFLSKEVGSVHRWSDVTML